MSGNLPQIPAAGVPGYPEGLCLFLCLGWAVGGRNADYTDRMETTHGFLTVYVFIKSFIV